MGRQPWSYGDATPKQHRARKFNWSVFVLAAMTKTLSLIEEHLDPYVNDLSVSDKYVFKGSLQEAQESIKTLSKVIVITHHDVRIKEKESKA